MTAEFVTLRFPEESGTITVECSHGHRWEMPTGWRIDGVRAIVCRDGEDVLAASGYVFEEGGSLTLDTTGGLRR